MSKQITRTETEDERLVDRMYQRGLLIDRLSQQVKANTTNLATTHARIRQLEAAVARQGNILERALLAVECPDDYHTMRQDEIRKREDEDEDEDES